jgi:hypothetical protein
MTQYIKFAATVYIILAVLILVTGIAGCDKLHMERVAEVKTTQITWIKETPKLRQCAGSHQRLRYECK